MPHPIDEVSKTLGSLEARQEAVETAVNNNTVILNNKLDKIYDNIVVANQSASKAHARIDALLAEHGEIDRLKKSARDYHLLKRRGVYALIGLSSASGAGASGIAKYLLAIFVPH